MPNIHRFAHIRVKCVKPNNRVLLYYTSNSACINMMKRNCSVSGMCRQGGTKTKLTMSVKARSHCSDQENDNDNDAKRTHSIG